MHRLFAALRPPPAIRARLLDLMGGVMGARWQDDDQLHLTLRFIGEVDARTADDIAEMLGTVRHPPVELALAGVGTFEKRGRVHTLWAGVRPPEPAARLHRKIDQLLVRLGLPLEARAYAPHITLARFARAAAPPLEPFLEAHAALTSEVFTCDSFALFESRIGRDGAEYTEVVRYPLT